jgi:RNAse (barnase) inhibitor barstar
MSSEEYPTIDDLDSLTHLCRKVEMPPVLRVSMAVINNSEFVHGLESASLFLIDLDRDQVITDKDSLMSALDEKAHFPWYFGRNWDALLDLLTDFHWIKAAGYLVLLRQPASLPEQDFATFREVIAEASNRWQARGVPFCLLIPVDS